MNWIFYENLRKFSSSSHWAFEWTENKRRDKKWFRVIWQEARRKTEISLHLKLICSTQFWFFPTSSSLRFHDSKAKLFSCADNYWDDSQSWRLLVDEEVKFWNDATLTRNNYIMFEGCFDVVFMVICRFALMKWMTVAFFLPNRMFKSLLMNHSKSQIKSNTKTNFLFITF